MLKWFSYTASFKLKVIKYAKNMATELLRDSLDLLPQRVLADCGGNRKKHFFRYQDKEGNAKETSKVAGGGAGGENLDSGAAPNWSLCLVQYKKKVKGLH